MCGILNSVKENLWNDAIKEASGVVPLTDTKKIKKAIKRIEKSKEKSSREWKVKLVLFI